MIYNMLDDNVLIIYDIIKIIIYNNDIIIYNYNICCVYNEEHNFINDNEKLSINGTDIVRPFLSFFQMILHNVTAENTFFSLQIQNCKNNKKFLSL